MGGRDPFVMMAIKNVVGRQSMDEWWAMPPVRRTEAIYAEIRRLDAETMRQRIQDERSLADELIYADA